MGGKRGAGSVNTMHLDDAMSLTIKVLYATGLLFLLAVLLPIPVMMLVASVYVLCIDWLHFFVIDYSTNNYNKSMLRMTRGGLLLVTNAIGCSRRLLLLQIVLVDLAVGVCGCVLHFEVDIFQKDHHYLSESNFWQ